MMTSVSIHLDRFGADRNTAPAPVIKSEAYQSENDSSAGPYVVVTLRLRDVEVTTFVQHPDDLLRLAASLEHVAGVLRTFEASLPSEAASAA